MNFSFENPRDIYQFVNREVDNLANKIQNLVHNKLNVEQNSLDTQHTYQIIQGLQTDIEESINDLENNAEWKSFQIAFFGETNAGKSTIIETLRILLNEPSKIEQNKRFKEITDKLDISAEKFYQVREELEGIRDKLNSIAEEKQLIEQKYTDKLNQLTRQEVGVSEEWDNQIQTVQSEYQFTIKEYQTKIHGLERKIEKIKANMYWFIKIIYYFIKLNEQKELIALFDKLEDIEYERDDKISVLQHKRNNQLSSISQQKNLMSQQQQAELKQIDEFAKSYELKKQPLQQWLDGFDDKKRQLIPYVDGQIIGDGRSDFTRDSTSYQFNINQYPIVMIDVPGIEGDEKQVQDEISKSVQKAHAIFYVTSKDAPPNEGTLERIKTYLNDQTEVWAIYNKQITNPRQLNNQLIKGDDEQQSLNGLEAILKETLGSHYCGLLVLAGLPAFYSQSTCIEPFSAMYESQYKFLDKVGRDNLYQFSQLEILNQKLHNEIVGNVPDKIRKSNFNKVKVLVQNSANQLHIIHQIYHQFEKDLIKKVQLAEQKIGGHFDDFEMQLRGKSNSIINDYTQSVRTKIYHEIDSDISNEDFKSYFNRIVKSEIDIFEQKIKAMIEQCAKELENNINRTQDELLREINELGKDYQKYGQIKEPIDFNLDIKNGINKMEMLGVAIGAALAMWWNPVGWFAIATTVSTLLFSFLKSVCFFFSSDYKKEQQRKNVDSHLQKITDKIKSEINKSLSELIQKMSKNKQKILTDLNDVSKSISFLNQDLKKVIHSLNDISSNIS